MIRRLKTDIKNDDGTERFPARTINAIDITYTDAEREAYDLLQLYTAARRAKPGAAQARAGDLVTLILKKRLFSSPAAFALTLEAHLESEDQNHHPERMVAAPNTADDLDWMDDVLGWDTEPSDDDPGSDDEREVFGRVASLPGILDDVRESGGSVMEAAYRRQLAEWAQRHAEPADTKAKALVAELNRVCRPDGDWDKGERVIVFTEYKATQQWLAGILTARGLGGDRLGLLFGGMDENKREHLKAAFQAGLDRDPVRILLATDAASEGIDLQRHCHRVIHYDIPFNPNRLEQRIGRVDRHGQTHEVEVSHFVGAGWDKEPEGSYAGDLEYLSRVARKVATERQDLGSVNPVLAHAVEARMLGRPRLIDPLQVTPKASTSLLRAERDLRDQVRKLHDQLDASVRELHVAPANVRRVVDTALALADQPPLADEPDGLIAPPALRAGWERTVTGLADPLDGHLRPFTFDAKVAETGCRPRRRRPRAPGVSACRAGDAAAPLGDLGRARRPQPGRRAQVHAARGRWRQRAARRRVRPARAGRCRRPAAARGDHAVGPDRPAGRTFPARGTGRATARGAVRRRGGRPRTGRLPPRPRSGAARLRRPVERA